MLDWEWSRLDGSPCVDLWSYQLAQLHLEAAGVEGLDQRVRAAVEHVEGELETVGVDPGFALATLPVVLSEQVIRVRRTLGAAGLWEAAGGDLMAAVERLLTPLGDRLGAASPAAGGTCLARRRPAGTAHARPA